MKKLCQISGKKKKNQEEKETYREIASICSMPDKSPQLTQDFLDDFAATKENLQHKWPSVRFFPKPSLKIYKFILSSFQ